MIRAAVAAVGLVVLGVASAPIASARTLDEIYQDMLILNESKPCEIATPATAACKESLQPKYNLANEVQPLLTAMPAPPRGPVDVGLTNIRYMSKNVDEYIASYCNSFPDTAAKLTDCTGESIQSLFDGLTQTVGSIVNGES